MRKRLLYHVFLLAIFFSFTFKLSAQQLTISTDRVYIKGSFVESEKTKRAYISQVVNLYLKEYDKKSSFPVYLIGEDSSSIQYNNLYEKYFIAGFDRENYSEPPYSVGIVITTNLQNPHEYLKIVDYGIKKEKKLRNLLNKKLESKGFDELTEEDIESFTITENQLSDIMAKPNKRVEKFIKKYNIEKL